MRASRAQSHANADFIGSLHDGVRNDTVQSDRRQNEGQNRKSSKEAGDQPSSCPFWLVPDPCFEVGDRFKSLLVGIDRCDLPADAVQNGFRRDAAANKDFRAHPQLRAVWDKDRGTAL